MGQTKFGNYPQKIYLCSKGWLYSDMIICLWIVITMLFGISDAQISVSQENIVVNETENEDIVKPCDSHDFLFDGEQLPYSVLLSAHDTQHFGSSSRHSRHHTLGGGKTGRFANYWETNNSYYYLYFLSVFFLCVCVLVQRKSASPRFYYVIVLRRFLC